MLAPNYSLDDHTEKLSHKGHYEITPEGGIMSDGASILLTIAGTAAGAVASWFTSRWYYRRSGSDLDAALRPLMGNDQQMIQALNALGRMLEQASIGKPTYDAAGNLTGVVVTGAGHIQLGGLRVSGFGTCTPPPQYDRQHEQPPSPESEGDHA
jgi:hypothetical protein